jgi:xylulokinase
VGHEYSDVIVIGVDVGTTGTKAGAYAVDGTVLATAHVATRLRSDRGVIEQDPRELLDSVHRSIAICVQHLGRRSTAVAGLAVTGQMAGVMGIDADWRPVTPYDSWLDGRCTPQLRRLAAEHGDLLTARTGCPPMLDHAPKMQWWRDERPDDYARVARFVMPAVYAAGSLAGLRADDAFIDPTYLHFTGAADARSGAWSGELLDALGLDEAKLPRIVPSDSVIGRLTPAAAERCGLVAGTPIAAGVGDTAAGALGAGIVAPGQLLDTAGTAAVLIGAVPDFRPDEDYGLIVMRSVLPGQWLPLNYVGGGGLCLPWLGAQLTTNAAPSAPESVSGAVLERLLAEAAEIPPGAEGVRFVPHFEGRIAPYDPELRGGWVGLSLTHTRAHMARAVLEAIAFEYAFYLQAMRRLHPEVEFSSARAIGGGARSALWNAIKADVLALPWERVEADETTTRGVALLAGAAVGIVDLATAAAGAPTAEPVEPDLARHAYYSDLVSAQAALIDALAAQLHPVSPAAERPLVV